MSRQHQIGIGLRKFAAAALVAGLSLTAAPVILRERDPHQAQLAQLRNELIGEALLAVQLPGDRRHLLARELAHHVAQQALLVAQLEVQEGGSLWAVDLRAA